MYLSFIEFIASSATKKIPDSVEKLGREVSHTSFIVLRDKVSTNKFKHIVN